MKNQYSRLELLIGEEALKELSTKRVLVFGLGGVGGNVCDALARSGIMHFDIVDNDVVDITNINRQLISNMNVLGRNKTDVMEEHLKSINPDIEVNKYNCFYLPEESAQFDFTKYDYVIDAIDTVKAKIDIIVKCKTMQIPVISALGCGNKMDLTKLEVSDLTKTSYDPLAKVLRHDLKKYNITHHKVIYSKEESIKIKNLQEGSRRSIPGSSAFVPPAAGILIAQTVIKDLLGK